MKKIFKQAAALLLCGALLIADIPAQYLSSGYVYAAETETVVDTDEDVTTIESSSEVASENSDDESSESSRGGVQLICSLL